MSAVTPLAIFDLFSDREDRSCSFDLGFTVVANSIARALQERCNRFATALQERCNSFARSLQVLRLCWTRLQVLCKVLRLLSTPLQVHLQGLCKCYACVGLDCNFYAHRRLDLPSEKIQEEMNVATRNLQSSIFFSDREDRSCSFDIGLLLCCILCQLSISVVSSTS